MSAFYNLKEINSEVSSVNYKDVGIWDNMEMTKIVFDKSKNENLFIAFYFEDEDGLQFSHTEWEPNEKDPQKLNDKVNNQLKRIKHLVTKYVTKEVFESIQANDFKSLCENILRVLGEKYKGVKVRTKITYNWSNFTSFPNYTPFLETMTTTPSKLKIGSGDKMIKDKADREFAVTSNPFPDTNVTTTIDSSPF